MTFIAALRVDRTEAPCVLEGFVNADTFHTCVEHFLVPTLVPSDVVVRGNLSSHKDTRLSRTTRALGMIRPVETPGCPEIRFRSRGPVLVSI